MNSDLLTSSQEALNICSTPQRLICAQATSKMSTENKTREGRGTERGREGGREGERARENQKVKEGDRWNE